LTNNPRRKGLKGGWWWWWWWWCEGDVVERKRVVVRGARLVGGCGSRGMWT